ncbi:MAG: tetratricopeptide repeat protein [Bacteroidota bacterium]
MSDRWHEIDTLFDQVLDLPVAERAAFLDAACAENPPLRAEVESLLASAEAGARWLGESVEGFAGPLWDELATALGEGAPEALPGRLRAGDVVGSYRLVRELGRGGMGTVWLADDERLGRQVALKVVKRGMDTDAVLARFRAEQRILASLEHPGIARLYDAGALPDGRPFLAMAYAEGEPLTQHADDHRLDVDARLARLLDVADAVAYAHQRLVVHRDLKPANILATADGGTRRVTLLDFGIAKLLDADSDGVQTRPGERPHTPAYAAPEQLGGQPATTATDVYALGAVAYELLTGHRPPPASDGAPPAKPSVVAGRIETRDGAPQASPEAVAQARGTTPERLARRLRGDLDTILLKALAADPARRYPTADAFAADLRRHRDGFPVAARPDGAGYRARTFVRRHRLGVAMGTVALLALVAVTVTVAAQQRATERARVEATAALAEADEVTAYLEGLFTAADPFAVERQDTLRARDLLARGVAAAERDLADQPARRARLLGVLGRAYQGLGRYADAEPLLRQALALRAGGPPLARAEAAAHLATLLQSRGAAAEAEALRREVLATRRAHLAAPHAALAMALNDLGLAAAADARYDEAELLLREALDHHRRLAAAQPEATPHADLASTQKNLADVIAESGQYDEAESLLLASIDTRRAHYGDAHPSVAVGLQSLATLLRDVGRHADAEPFVREALAVNRAALGSDHPHVADNLNLLGSVLRGQDRFAEAAPVFDEAVARTRAHRGDRHPDVANVLNTYAGLLIAQGDHDRAEAVMREAVAIAREGLGAEHVMVGLNLARLGIVLHDSGAVAQALPIYREAEAILEPQLGDGHLHVALLRGRLGASLADLGRHAEAEAPLRASLDALEALHGPDHDRTRHAQAALDTLYAAWRPARAE